MGSDDSALVSFYRGQGVDHRGRTVEDVLGFDDQELESTHDYIQWLFPLTTPSQFNAEAPLLSQRDIDVIRSSPELQFSVVRSLGRMLVFYGFELLDSADSAVVRKSDLFGRRAPYWRTPGNHNYLRITRILRSLNLLGLARYARAFLDVLETSYAEAPAQIGERALSFWRSAGSPHGQQSNGV